MLRNTKVTIMKARSRKNMRITKNGNNKDDKNTDTFFLDRGL